MRYLCSEAGSAYIAGYALPDSSLKPVEREQNAGSARNRVLDSPPGDG
jgi:hypothetical protein